MKMKKVRSVLLAAALTCSMIVTPVMAAPDDTTSLQNQKESAQNEVNGLQAQLNELFTKTNDLETQLINKGQEITKAQEDLAVAEEKKQQQYEDMKLRIKYMYEEGDTSALERIVASGSISEMLTQTEYVEKVHTYDRDKLREYAETVQEVEDLKTSLESDMTKLQNLDEEYKTQTAELSSTIESKRAEVSNLDAMIQEAARAAVEAAKKEQEKNNTVNNENTNTPSGGGDNSGGTVTPAPEPTPTPTPTPTPEPNYNPSTGNAVVDRAYSWVGKAEYVWGACSPGAFDCSGFVCWVFSNSGVHNLPRTTAQGIYDQCTPVSAADAKAGDIIFFTGTYNAGRPVTHVGIYCGNGTMVHCGDPIQYTSINTSYWQSHFYGFGRW